MREDRQLRVKPMAMTMVVASTISTKHATKVAMTRPQVAAVTRLSSQAHEASVSFNSSYMEQLLSILGDWGTCGRDALHCPRVCAVRRARRLGATGCVFANLLPLHPPPRSRWQ